MTFNDNAQIGGNRVRVRRGSGAAGGIAVGGGAGIMIILFLLSQLFGIDLTGLGPVVGGQPQEQGPVADEAVPNCATGEDANAPEAVDCRVAGASDSLDQYWAGTFQSEGIEYQSPSVIIFSDAVNTQCGQASSAVGPFYCPADQTIYIDTTFYQTLRQQFGTSVGSTAEMYVIAHEWGHHVSNLTGTLGQAQTGETGPDSPAVRLELQADCYAGAWLAAASTTTDSSGTPLLQPISPQQLADALDAARAIGDDNIQSQSGGGVNPEAWTHGSSEQRQRWLQAGFDGGPAACDTFNIPGDQL